MRSLLLTVAFVAAMAVAYSAHAGDGRRGASCRGRAVASASDYSSCVGHAARAGVNPALACRPRPVICVDYGRIKRLERKRSW